MERSGPHVQLKLKRETRRKDEIFLPFFFGIGSERGRHELDRERRETPTSLYDLRRSGGRNPSS